LASFTIIGQVHPGQDAPVDGRQARRLRFEGEPPYMSVTTTTPCPAVHGIGGIADLGCAGGAVILGPDRDRDHAACGPTTCSVACFSSAASPHGRR
jgi:hypothetical protein